MISNLAVFEGGEAAIHKLSKAYPKYDECQTQAKIEHFYNSGTNPMTCAKIAENGFVCPKMKDGSCTCKSPAALAFIPATVDELKKALAAVKPKHEAAEDICLAQHFIEEWLYNSDPAFAEVFINHNIKAHFGLTASDIKALPAFQKDVYKAFESSKEARHEKSGDYPPWYEFGERGGLKFLPGALAEHMAANVYAFFAAEQYYFYENGVYTPKSDLQAQALTRTFMISRYAQAAHISDAEIQWRMLIIKPIREINANPYLLNVRNGMYNVLEDAFIPHDPKYYTTVQLGGRYDPNAECPLFMRFLSEILPESEIPIVQEMMGYFCVPINKAQKSFVLVGAPKAGKSTILSLVQDTLLGAENVSNISWQNLSDRFKPAELFGKLANIFADLPSKTIEDGDMFKSLTGEDSITAERKNKDAFSFKPYARLLFSCNEVPRNYGDRSEAFYRRLLIIRFTKSVSEEKRDPDLKEKLAMERDGILMWAIAGLKRLIIHNYQFSETERTREEIHRYKLENNSVLSFVEECCAVEKNAECFRDDLFGAYKAYCLKNGLKAMSQISFNRDIETSVPPITRQQDKITHRRTYSGLRVL
jgi:putative DNA primase/helicase